MELVILLVTIVPGFGLVSVVQHPPVLRLSLGERAQMTCNVNTDKKVKILHSYWKVRRTQEVTLENTTRIIFTPTSLVISLVTPRDIGLYICSYRDSSLEPYRGDGTHLLITAAPSLTLREDTEKHLLICQAERFYPPDLNISWSFLAKEEQPSENLTENEDGTFTKVSIMTLTEEVEGKNVACQVDHVTLRTVLYRYDLSTFLYLQLFPLRVAVLLMLTLVLVAFQVYHHYKAKVSSSRKI